MKDLIVVVEDEENWWEQKNISSSFLVLKIKKDQSTILDIIIHKIIAFLESIFDESTKSIKISIKFERSWWSNSNVK